MSGRPDYLDILGGITRQSMESRYEFDNAGASTVLFFGL
jgi:hypothetical protein